jgi:hypothetical protein
MTIITLSGLQCQKEITLSSSFNNSDLAIDIMEQIHLEINDHKFYLNSSIQMDPFEFVVDNVVGTCLGRVREHSRELFGSRCQDHTMGLKRKLTLNLICQVGVKVVKVKRNY